MAGINKIFEGFSSRRRINNRYVFDFLFGIKSKFNQFKINIDTKCLVLSQYPGAEIKGLGGLIARYPKNFEILCFTNGSLILKDMLPLESSVIKKQQFNDVMKLTKVKGYKIFDIETQTLKNHLSTIKKIDISEVDYIFVPNIYDSNIDTFALLSHFKEILSKKEHKSDLKILMYESDYSLCTFDFYIDISSIIETKKKLLRMYYPVDKFQEFTERMIGLNSFRAIQIDDCNFAEVFLAFTTSEFLKIPLL